MRKFLFVVIIAFILLSCDTEPMSTEINPFIGAWGTAEQQGNTAITSMINFTENTFFYQVLNINHSDPHNPITVEKIYNGNYTYNENSKTIFFEIQEPENEIGVTSSQYQFYGDKLYCYGNKFLVIEKLHDKQALPQ